MVKSIISYAASNGMQRAISFLASLLLLRAYTPGEVGEYVLIQTVAQLLIPVATLNVTVALTREASVDVYRTAELLKKISSFVLASFVLVSLALPWAGQWSWICAALMLGLAEALYSALTAFLMGRENSAKVLKISLVRVTVFFVLLLATYTKFLTILHMVILMAGFLAGLGIAVAWSIISRVQKNERLKSRAHISISSMYRYSIVTLPHTAALWCSASSDRAILGALNGKEAVGQYAVAFTLAQSVMVLIAGVISAIPPRIMNDIDTWTNPFKVTSFFAKIAALSFLINIFALLAFFINNVFLEFVPNSRSSDMVTLSLIGSGYFMSLFYVFFASYLYQRRDTKALSWMGFFLLPFNLGVMYLFVLLLGKVGAAAGLVISYTSFGAAYCIAAVRLVPQLRASLLPIACISLAQIVASLMFASFLIWLAH